MATHRHATLFETTHGRVRRCACCDRLELRFGNALLSLGVDELPGFLAELDVADLSGAEAARARGAPRTAAGGREVTFWLGETGAGWVFSPAEAAELHRLAAGARLMLELAAPPAA